jgi:Family of unknown function (DUF5989)
MSRKKKHDQQERNDAFELQAAERPTGLVREFWDFLRHNKKWWLTPIVVMLLLVMALVLLGGTAMAPFIYTLF